MDLTPILSAAQGADAAARQAAGQQLAALEAQNFGGFMALLVQELASEAKPAVTRQLAGLIMKNAVYSDDAARCEEKAGKWEAVDPSSKAQIRATLLATLGSPVGEARHTAAQVVGKVGALDLSAKSWPELIPALQANVTGAAAGVKQATLEALGFVCEGLEHSALEQAQVNVVLTAVVAGMAKEQEAATRVVATKALDNALAFAKINFEKKDERDYLMATVCACAEAPEPPVREAALECLANIAEMYYKVMQPYMGQIFQISNKALTDGSSEEIAMQALMIWSNVCTVEEQLDEGENFRFSAAAAPQLVPLLLGVLPSKSDVDADADDDEWSLAEEAHLCLQSLAYVVGNPVRDAVMPYVQGHVASADWRAREAAVNAFAAIVAGPDQESTLPVVRSALVSLLTMIKDPAKPVRRAATFAVSYCLQALHVGAEDEPQLLTPEALPPLLAVLTEAMLTDDAVVGNHAVDALSNLAEGYLGAADTQSSTPLSPYFQSLVQALLQAAAGSVRPGAYGALEVVISAAAEADAATLGALLPHMLQLVCAATAAPAPTPEAAQAKVDVQGVLCGVLMTLTLRLSRLGPPHDAPLKQHADAMMAAYLSACTSRSDTVNGDALLAIGALIGFAGAEAEKYVAALWPVLELALRNYAEYEVCATAVDVVGDLCRALGEKVAPYADAIMMVLLTNLAANELAASVKPAVVSAFGDVALALGPSFEKYFANVLPMLAGAAQHAAASAAAANAAEDEAGISASCSLRTAIMEAYCGIIQGVADQAKLTPVAQQGPGILEFIAVCCVDPHALEDPALLLAAVGLVGDMAKTLPGMAALCARRNELATLLQRSRADDADEAVQEAAKFTEQMVKTHMNGIVPGA